MDENVAAAGFEPETRRRMAEVFAGQFCCTCCASAERLHGGEFYCPEHHPQSRKPARPVRVYHCQLAAEAA